jgi:hypothetical protein
MKLSLKKVMAFAAAAVLLVTGSASAFSAPPVDSPALMSGRASALLVEIHREAKQLGPHANTLGTFANSRLNWQSHVYYLEKVKTHINAIGERLAELQSINASVLPWQQQAISEITAHAAQVAQSTQAAIVFGNANQSALFAAEYRDHLSNIADSSENMKDTVGNFLDYEKTQQKFLQLQHELELAGD